VLIGLLVAVIARRRPLVMVLVVILVPTLSLLRRVVAGASGYTESDPLILLPLILTLGVVVVSWGQPRVSGGARGTKAFAVTVVLGVLASVLLTSSFTVDALFFAGLIVIPLLFAIATSTGRMPLVWGYAMHVLPALGAIVGTYGLYQFFVLPDWDRAWMRTSQLTSIGHPEPLEVRVFGMSESPGPYALFLGLVIVLCLAAAVTTTRWASRVGWIALGGYVAYPLLLSGVRSTLVGVGVCAVVLILVRARGLARILLLGFLAGAWVLLTTVVNRFSASSTILTSDRYTEFSTDDDSFVARIDLLSSVGNPFRYIVGNPAARAVDNLFVDVLLRYGLVAAIGMLLLICGIVILALRQLVAKRNEVAALCAIFIATQVIFGPTFNSLFGILVGVVFGTVMAVPLAIQKDLTATTTLAPATAGR